MLIALCGFFRLLAVAAERVEGHLEGRWRAAALREDDRVICQTGKGHEFTAPADLSACLTPLRSKHTHTRTHTPPAPAVYARGSGSDGIRVR